MKRRLRTLNKPAVKTIQTPNGDIFDCVDIYQQPAFDHPLLKNYTIPPRPLVSSNATTAIFELPDGGCPDGTVPIRRVQMQDLLRARSLSAFGKKYGAKSPFRPSLQSPDLSRWAKIDTRNGDYYGTYAHINLWTPYVKGNDKSSSAQVWLYSGSDNQLNVIEGGWMVNAELFGNPEPRLFIYWTVDRYDKTGCFNTLCPGFVTVHPRTPLGGTFGQMSSPGGDQYFMRIKIVKEKLDWWLYVNDRVIGFWPQQIFNHLNEKAEKVGWGGEVYSSEGKNFPPMGSGAYSKEGWQQACFIKKIQVVNGNNQYLDGPRDTDTFVDRNCYSLTDNGVNTDPNWRRYIYFGGPGGRC
ncbi:protein neprosin-like isoform X2 [Aristolochia californica]|uniref:protein neprosin-like isoform X2 n=1 Tax=Aristolochia californica TaxID=171875 RepID=UPI0035D73A85